MSSWWSLTCSTMPGGLALALLVVALAVVVFAQERGAQVLTLRCLAVMIAVCLLADVTLSRSATTQVVPPVAVVQDVSASMDTIDRQLPADRLLDWAEALHRIDSKRRSSGPRRMATILATVQEKIPALVANVGSSAAEKPDEDLRLDEKKTLTRWAADLTVTAAGGAGYRDAERLCRDTAAALSAIAKGDPRDSLVALLPKITALLPRLAVEQTAGDAALLSGWRAAGDPDAAIVDLLATTSRGELAAQLIREQLLPILAAHSTATTFGLSDRLIALAPSSLRPGTQGTDFAALADLARGWETTLSPGALIFISDGRNHGGDPRPALRAMQARGARLLLIGVGASGAPDEPALLELDGPETARSGARLTLSVTIRPGGPGWNLVVTADNHEVLRQEVSSGSNANITLRTNLEAGSAGLRHFTARLEKAGAPSSPARTCPVRVTDSAVRVVVVDGVPRWETRALVAALEADPMVTVERRFLQGPAPVTEAFPQAVLSTANAVVLGDLTPAELSTEDQTRLAAFVADGGVLIVVAGPRGMPASFPLGPLAELLPVRPARDGLPAPAAAIATAQLSLTSAGETHRVCRLINESDLNRRLWTALPGPEWFAGGIAARPEATVLVNLRVSATTSQSSAVPALAVGTAGRGHVLWCGIPESWRWQSFSHGRAHTAFWTNVLRWGISTQPQGLDTRLRIALTPSRIDTQGSAELFVSSTYPAADPQATIIDEAGQLQALQLVPQAPGRWRAGLADLSDGLYRINVRLNNAPTEVSEACDLLVRPLAARELADPTAELAALRLLANDLNATYVEIAEAVSATKDIAKKLTPQSVTTLTTWRSTDGLWAAGLLSLLLCCEWWYRKRLGLP